MDMMDLLPASLRGKIILGFSILAATVVLSLLITFIETSLIEEQLEAQKQSHVLLNAIYEIRRQEKNYLLYRQAGDLGRLVASVGDLDQVLQRSVSHDILSDDVETMKTVAAGYAGIVAQLSTSAHQEESSALASALRERGSRMIEGAKTLTEKIEGRIAAKFRRLKIWLLASKVFLAGLAVAAAFSVSAGVLRSLKDFKQKMDGIVEGTLRELPQTARDEEVAALERACNRMLSEISLRQAHLVQSEKLASVGTMLAGIAHELNNPLSNISSSCQILLEEFQGGESTANGASAVAAVEKHGEAPAGCSATIETEELSPSREELLGEMLHRIFSETERARITIRSLLDYSRTAPAEKKIFPLLPLIHETLMLFQGRLAKGVALTVNVPEGVQVYGDRHRLQQVFVNLLKNALDALDTGGGAITIEAGVSERPRQIDGGGARGLMSAFAHVSPPYVGVRVSDTGKGIRREDLPRIFDPFFTTKDVGKGTGLGLFIAKEIVEGHRGAIAAESEEGKGTTFVLRLPARGDDRI
jgi:signal transduction histidine kinase